jgi:hypothetical protein
MIAMIAKVPQSLMVENAGLKSQHQSNENESTTKFSVMQYKKQPVASFVDNYGYLRPGLGDNRIP